MDRHVPFDKFDPHKASGDDPLRAATPEAARRVLVLKWGMLVSQGMFYMGLVLLAYWMLR